MDEETTEKTQILRIKNHNRYKDYFIRVRKKVPVFGADWEKREDLRLLRRHQQHLRALQLRNYPLGRI